MSKTSDKIRVEWKANDATRDQGLSTPDNIIRYDDIVYGEDGTWNVLDVYKPKKCADVTLPVIINVHGGGWVYGDKELYQFYCMDLAKRGFAVINYSYRLAPESKFPAQLEDLNSVVLWMMDNADKYGLEKNKVFLFGDSAGANLASLYASICTNEEYANNYKFQVPSGFVPGALCLNCGAFAPIGSGLSVVDEESDSDLMSDLLPNGGDENEAKLINSTLHVTKNYPCTYIMSALGDMCLEQAYLMDKVLREHNVEHEFCIYGKEDNPLHHVFHIDIKDANATGCNDDECNFVKRYI